MITLSIIGSCITRDVFNSKHVKNWKSNYEVLSYQSQITFPSLMSRPIEYDKKHAEYKNMDDFSINQIQTEMNKSILNELFENQPEYILIDFYGDLFFGIVKDINGGYLTNKRWLFSRTNIFNNNIEKGQTLSFENNLKSYYKIWKKSIDSFFDFIKTNLPNTKLILHQSEFVDSFKIENVTKFIKDEIGVDKDVNFLNEIWDQMNKYIINNYNVLFIDQRKNYKLDPGHIWGSHYVHFEKQYYIDFKNKLDKIIIKNELIDYDERKNNEKEISKNLEIKDWQIINNVQILDKGILNIKSEGNLNNQYQQCASIPVDISPFTTIKIKFKLYIDSKIKLDDTRILAVRSFDQKSKYKQSDANQYMYMQLKEYQLDEWMDIEYETTVLDGNYLKVIPILFRNGSIFYKDFNININ